MNSGPLPPRKIQVNPSAENWGQLLEWIQANPHHPPERTLQKMKALLEWIQAEN